MGGPERAGAMRSPGDVATVYAGFGTMTEGSTWTAAGAGDAGAVTVTVTLGRPGAVPVGEVGVLCGALLRGPAKWL